MRFGIASALILTVLTVPACKQRRATESSALGSGSIQDEIPSTELTSIRLGDGHNLRGGQTFPGCIVIDPTKHIDVTPPKNAQFRIAYNSSLDVLKNTLDANVDGQISINSSDSNPMDIKGALQMARSAQPASYRTSFLVVFRQWGGVARLKPRGGAVQYELTDAGKNLVGQPQEAIQKTCGDSLIGAIDLGATLAMSMTLDFKSASDKRNFEASGSFSNLPAEKSVDNPGENSSEVAGAIRGAYESLVNGTSSSTDMTIELEQFGGIGAELGKAVDKKSIQCSAKDVEKCIKQAEKFIRYAQYNWPLQFKQESGSDTHSEYSKYAFTKVNPHAYTGYVDAFQEIVINDVQADLYRDYRFAAVKRFLREEVDLHRVEFLLNLSREGNPNLASADELNKVSSKILRRLTLMAEAYTKCRNIWSVGTQRQCIGDKETNEPSALDLMEAALVGPDLAYDPAVLTFTPYDYTTYCENYRAWHEAKYSTTAGSSSPILLERMMPTWLVTSFEILANQCQFMNPNRQLCEQNQNNFDTKARFTAKSPGIVCDSDEPKSAATVTLVTARIPDTAAAEIAGELPPLATLDPLVIFTEVTRLDITRAAPASLIPLRGLRKLQTVIWDDGTVRDEALRELRQLGRFRNVSLRSTLNTVLDEEGYKTDAAPFLKGLKDVENLDLSGNERLLAISEIDSLELLYLNIAGTRVADDADTCQSELEKLRKKIPHKKTLAVYAGSGCQGVSVADVSFVSEARIF